MGLIMIATMLQASGIIDHSGRCRAIKARTAVTQYHNSKASLHERTGMTLFKMRSPHTRETGAEQYNFIRGLLRLPDLTFYVLIAVLKYRPMNAHGITLHQHINGVFDVALEELQEFSPHRTINRTVINRQRTFHECTDLDHAVIDVRFFLTRTNR